VSIEGTEGNWITGESAWGQLPMVNKKIRIKISGSNLFATVLTFQLQNIKTGQLFITEPQYLFQENITKEYINKLNGSVNTENVPVNLDLPSEPVLHLDTISTKFIRTLLVSGISLGVLSGFGAIKAFMPD